MTLAEIQARHGEHYKNHGWNPNGDIGRMFEDVKFLLSDRKRLLDEHAEAILHKNLAIKSLEIINREQETEIRLLREVVKACDVFMNDEGLELSAGFKMHDVARAALAEFDKGKA